MDQMNLRPRKQRIKDNKKQTFKKRLIATVSAGIFTSVFVTAVYMDEDIAKAKAFVEKYTVQKGDTLFGLSKKYNSSVEEIKATNSLKSDTILIGQQLVVPNPESKATTVHTVKKGETVYSISKLYQIEISDLKKQNSLKDNHIIIGQKLKITFYKNGSYVVKKGDTLHSIAKQLHLTVDELKKLNKLQSNTIKIGQTLTVPNKIEATNAKASVIPNKAPTTNTEKKPIVQSEQKPNNSAKDEVKTSEMGITEFYTVAAGDTLWSIAQRFDVPFATLKTANKLTVEEVLAGQKLFIPGPKQFEAAEIVGAADNHTVEFLVKGHPVALKVAKGSASNYQKSIGKKVFISYKNGALVSIH
jgi:peptidoglycan DL-endopeptidase CwlS